MNVQASKPGPDVLLLYKTLNEGLQKGEGLQRQLTCEWHCLWPVFHKPESTRVSQQMHQQTYHDSRDKTCEVTIASTGKGFLEFVVAVRPTTLLPCVSRGGMLCCQSMLLVIWIRTCCYCCCSWCFLNSGK